MSSVQADALVVVQNNDEGEGKKVEDESKVESTELVLDDNSKLKLPQEGTDPKVMEFLRILDEYRLKNENEGNYEEAERASKQLDNLRKQEIKRQIKALKARQLAERQDIQIAHEVQFSEFNKAWDKYLKEFDEMSQQYIKQMTDRHASELQKFQDNLYKKLSDKPPKFSKELLEWRRRQHILARQKNYAEAQKIKHIADMMEDKEKNRLNGNWKSSFSHKEAAIRSQQKAELSALLKRIEVRRKEHMAQRAGDSKRLIQRNKNVQTVLSNKQAAEERAQREQIKIRLSRPRKGLFGDLQPTARRSSKESKGKERRKPKTSKAGSGKRGKEESKAFFTQ